MPIYTSDKFSSETEEWFFILITESNTIAAKLIEYNSKGASVVTLGIKRVPTTSGRVIAQFASSISLLLATDSFMIHQFDLRPRFGNFS